MGILIYYVIHINNLYNLLYSLIIYIILITQIHVIIIMLDFIELVQF